MRYVKIVGALVLLVLMFACEDFKEEEYYPTEFDEGMFSFLDNDYAALRDTVVALSVIRVDSAFSDSLMDAMVKILFFKRFLILLTFLLPVMKKLWWFLMKAFRIMVILFLIFLQRVAKNSGLFYLTIM